MKITLLFLLAIFTVEAVQAQVKDGTIGALDTTLRELPDQRTYNSRTYYNSKDENFTTVVSAGFLHYRSRDGSYRDIDTRFHAEDFPERSAQAFAMSQGLFRVRVDNNANAGRDYDVTLEMPRPVREKFRSPDKGPAAPTHLRWKLLSFGYLDLQQFLYRPLEFPNPVQHTIEGNRLAYPEIFHGIDLRYTCNATSFKEEFVLSQKGRDRLPEPEQIGFVRERTYLMFYFEFKLTPANLQVFARTSSGRVPVKEGGRFAFNGEGQVEVEDEDTNLRFFLPEDYAWAVADSLNDFSGRSKIRRFIYTDRGKDYMLVGVPWDWVNAAPKGNLIIDPTTTAVSNHDTRLQDGGNYGTGAVLAIGKPTGFIKRRTIIKLDLTGIPTNATVLNAQLKLWYYSNNGTPANNRWVQAHQLLVNWDELQATRDNRLTATPWAAQYGALDGTDANASYESTLLFSQTEQLLQWKTWDLSALTQKWVKVSGPGSAPNYGVVLWATNEDTDGHAMQFNSSEAASNQPYLEIIWSNTPKTVYFLKDHLGSIRATVLDSATAPVIGYEDYDPWGYPLAGRTKAIPNAYLQGASKNKFTGKGRDDEFGLNLDYFGARYYDHLVGRWISVDPLGAIHPEDSHYSYTGNEPINRVDPNGMDWFRNKGTGEVDWFETSAEGFSDQDRNSWQNVGTEAIYFNGVDLTAIVQEGNVIDGYNFDKLQVEAVSGRPLDGGEFDYSIERQLLLNEGPLPEGVYYINPQKTQYWRNLSWLDKFYALIGQGPWPGGLSSWGESRVWLQPNSIKLIDPRTGQEILRSSFSIHGGNTPGSGGCIDCYSNAPKFFGFISKLRSSSVPVIVDYKTNGGR